MDEHLKTEAENQANQQNIDHATKVPPNDVDGESSPENIAPEITDPQQVSKRIAANRQNARKSTGPRTAAGKRRVARNAIKHGFFSSSLLVGHPDAEENAEEYNALCKEIRNHYKPNGFLEEFFTEQIAASIWRLRRVMRFESGAINKAYLGRRSTNLAIGKDGIQEEMIDLDAVQINPRDYLLIPDYPDSDKILRYETMLRKHLNHAMSKLEELQSSRCSDQLERPGLNS